jgi:hypothetical protein
MRKRNTKKRYTGGRKVGAKNVSPALKGYIPNVRISKQLEEDIQAEAEERNLKIAQVVRERLTAKPYQPKGENTMTFQDLIEAQLTGNTVNYSNTEGIFLSTPFDYQSAVRFGQTRFQNGGVLDDKELFCTNEQLTDAILLYLDGGDPSDCSGGEMMDYLLGMFGTPAEPEEKRHCRCGSEIPQRWASCGRLDCEK